jgi:hypothetical protein
MAAANPLITAEAYDLNHFPTLREKYKVMSVPCLVINDTTVTFDKKNIRELFGLRLDRRIRLGVLKLSPCAALCAGPGSIPCHLSKNVLN